MHSPLLSFSHGTLKKSVVIQFKNKGILTSETAAGRRPA